MQEVGPMVDWDHSRSLEIAIFDTVHRVPILAFLCYCVPMLYHFWTMRQFQPGHVYVGAPLGHPMWISTRSNWRQKTKVPAAVLCGVVCVILTYLLNPQINCLLELRLVSHDDSICAPKRRHAVKNSLY